MESGSYIFLFLLCFIFLSPAKWKRTGPPQPQRGNVMNHSPPHPVVGLLSPKPPLSQPLTLPPLSAFVSQAGALHSGASEGTTSRPSRWLKCRISSEFSARAGRTLSAGIICTCERQLFTYTINKHTHKQTDFAINLVCLDSSLFFPSALKLHLYNIQYISMSDVKLLLSIAKVLLHPELNLKDSENTHFIQLPLACCQLELWRRIIFCFLGVEGFFCCTFL